MNISVPDSVRTGNAYARRTSPASTCDYRTFGRRRHCSPLPDCQKRASLHRFKLFAFKENDAWQSSTEAKVPLQPIGTACVVGAGAAGLIAALGLARFGMEVHVFDKEEIGHTVIGAATHRVILSPAVIVALQAQGLNVYSQTFRQYMLYTTEFRATDCRMPRVQVAQLPGGQVYTTYGHLQKFLVSEIERLVPGLVKFHSGHELVSEDAVKVDAKLISFSSPSGPYSMRYDLLVGAEGVRSNVRRSILKKDPSMKSQLSFVGPIRYVTVGGLAASGVEWPDAETAKIAEPPLDSLYEAPSIETGASRVQLASPVDILGWPLYGWGGGQYYKVKLTLFQDPGDASAYIGTFEGTPELFSELDDALEQGGTLQLLTTLDGLFNGKLPQVWINQLASAVASRTFGLSKGATLVANKLASPDKAPAVVLVGDAGHATTWRMGYSLQTAIETAAALGAALKAAPNLREALLTFSEERQPEAAALAQLDRLAPAFFGEEAAMGPLAVIIQTAISLRMWLRQLMMFLRLYQYAPFASYLQAMQAGVLFQDVYKQLLRDTTIVTGFLCSAFFSFCRVLYAAYDSNRYLFV